MSDKNITIGNNSVVITDTRGLKPGSAIGVGAMVIGNGTFDDALRSDLIKLLNELRIDHYSDFNEGRLDCGSYHGLTCDCGADEHNAKIDAMIKRLTRGE